MKVLLARPPAPNALSFIKILDNEPLELEYLHTVLRDNGHEDYIYDGLIEKDPFKSVIIREKPDMVAITGYITQEKIMLGYARTAKAIDANIVTVLGGVHAQRNHERLFSEHVDYILRSEDVGVLISLIQGESIGGLNGLCRRENGAVILNPLKPTDINSLPVPDREFFYRNRKQYRYLDLTEVASIKTAFSCPYDCNFCYCTLLNGGRYAARDLRLVLSELEGIDAQNIQIVDDDFLVDRERVLEFIRLVKERGIHKSYICYTRADFAANNPDIINALAGIGFKYFLVGLEAVVDTELAGYAKGTTVEVNRRCVEVIHSAGAECIALMIAPIDATAEYFRRLYDWIVANGLKYVTVSIFTPIPGTPLYEEYESRLISQNIEDWDFLHLVLEPVNMSKAAFYREYYRLFLKLYRLAKKSGIYDFMDLEFYKNLMADYLRRKARGE